jgi:bifunctional non-homologous end joining protein LigD
LLRLPEPMLAKTGPMPITDDWIFEPKMDGFRCLVCTHGGRFRARSRRGWDMTKRLPDLGALLPADVQLDGELVAWDANGHPDWHLLGRRMLHGDLSIPVTLMVFDVLAVEGLSVMSQPYEERRSLLEMLVVEPSGVQLVATFEDGRALFDVICERGLEGVVGKRRRDPYRPGERLWVKAKNRNTRRFAAERARATAPSRVGRSVQG